ncbi:MAG: hypothetical protein ACI92G_001604 [Candidatus Pelagisphaera sp.]|jgi:hypothetical protein
MKSRIWLFRFLILCLSAFESGVVTWAAQPSDEEPIRIVQLIQGNQFRRMYPDAVTGLLESVSAQTTLNVDPDPLVIESFDDPAIFKHPFIYVNYSDRPDWELSESEKQALKRYIARGGFIYIDAGISASFLGDKNGPGQGQSFAEWRVRSDLVELFKEIVPETSFRPLPRTHGLFRSFHAGLPDSSVLPDTVQEFVVNEKWPQGSYSSMGLEVDGRLAVLAMPIVAMGWGRNEVGKWTTRIGFRIRESAEGLSDRLSEAYASGEPFEVTREDGRADIIYTQNETMPSWVQEAGGGWRVFQYHYSQEISDYAHVFYTQLGVNIVVYVFTE